MTSCRHIFALQVQAVEDLCLHKMAAGLYERLQKVCLGPVLSSNLTATLQGVRVRNKAP